jgi:PKD repeat protein
VTLIVTDDEGGVGTDTLTVTVNDLAPTADFSWSPEPQDEGSPVQFIDGSTSFPDLIVEWSWDFGGLGTSTDQDPAFTFIDDGIYTVTLTVTDDDGSTDTIAHTVIILNVAPTLSDLTSASLNENNWFTLTGTITDPSHLDSFTVTVNWGDGYTEIFDYVAGSTGFSEEHQCLDDNPTGTPVDIYSVTVTVEDDNGGIDSATSSVDVSNVAPVLSEITSEVDPVLIGVEVIASSFFSDVGTLDTHIAVWDWGDTASTTEPVDPGDISATHIYTEAGVYIITLTLYDDDTGEATTEYRYIVIYDPSEGFVTGAGWILSPEGAYVEDPSLTGRSMFGFVSKYMKGATTPTGRTKFMFHTASLNFQSDSYDWLVVAGAKAKYKGIGTINGEGEYKFILTAFDGESDQADTFRIRIWLEDEETGLETVIYDNMLGLPDDEYGGTEIGGGNIVVHTKK